MDTATLDNPGTPGQPINPDNQNGQKWPNGTDKDSSSKTVTRTINYVDQNGNKIHPSTTQTVTFTRYATVDEVTGEVVYGKQSIINSVNLTPDIIDVNIDVVNKKMNTKIIFQYQ